MAVLEKSIFCFPCIRWQRYSARWSQHKPTHSYLPHDRLTAGGHRGSRVAMPNTQSNYTTNAWHIAVTSSPSSTTAEKSDSSYRVRLWSDTCWRYTKRPMPMMSSEPSVYAAPILHLQFGRRSWKRPAEGFGFRWSSTSIRRQQKSSVGYLTR
jgi:hypothetical protein